MSTSPTRADLITLMLKNSLEYNAGITSMAVAYIGIINNPRSHKRFMREYDRFTKEYIKKQEAIANDLAKTITF